MRHLTPTLDRTKRARHALLALGIAAAALVPAGSSAAGAEATKSPKMVYAGSTFVNGSCIGSTMGFEWPYLVANGGDWFLLYNGVVTDAGSARWSNPYYLRVLPGGGKATLDMYGNPTSDLDVMSIPYGEGNSYGVQWLYDYQTGEWFSFWATPAC